MPHPLDDRAYVTELDPKGMLALTDAFADQCNRALEIASSVDLDQSFEVDQVVVTGLGGSAAGGDFAKALCEAQGSKPLVVNRDYHLPSFVGNRTLVFATSYSGNTEETLSAYEDAKKRGAKVIALTSGGALSEQAKSHGDPIIFIPAGHPPRTALGYLMVPIVVCLERFGVLPPQPWGDALRTLGQCLQLWTVESPMEDNPAKKMAVALHESVSVLYGLGGWQSVVANRWKGQINENAKAMTFANAFPELCHNEILGWVKAGNQGVRKWTGVVLCDGSESNKMKMRAQVTRELTESLVTWHEARAHGDSLLAKLLSLTLLGDYVSLYWARLNDVDPENIDSINLLKARLSQVTA